MTREQEATDKGWKFLLELPSWTKSNNEEWRRRFPNIYGTAGAKIENEQLPNPCLTVWEDGHWFLTGENGLINNGDSKTPLPDSPR